ncbi:MAG TPA: AAA family ATPase [Bacteroidales bacterium]|nr:AAA family ATPase [Bacteroidales bacterium]HPS17507.1 AAA family ATPase [Bacteroidales bacterium]
MADKKPTSNQKFKFKEIKIYGADEWMIDSTKKYRRVYDKQEATYISAELSFYNKFFDEESWEAKLCLKAFSLNGKERNELCKLEEVRTIKPEDNIVYYRQGWGMESIGAYWGKGNYEWEAYIDDEPVGTQKFYVEDVGLVTSENNPYFTIESLKLYPAYSDNIDQGKRKYLTKFKRSETPYVWLEMSYKIKTSKDWFCEFFFNFLDDAGQLKGRCDSLKYFEKNNQGNVFTTTVGWGSDKAGSWKDNAYRLEIVFMDTLVASITFEVGDEEVEGIKDVNTTSDNTASSTSRQQVNKPVQDELTLEAVMKQLDELIGLSEIKNKIHDHVKYLDFIKLRKEKGLSDNEKISLHSVFTGNPGTGKTTVVNLLGKIYCKMGLLSKGHVLEVDRADLVGEFIGQTAPKVKAKINEARGGILFIDEAYMLYRSDNDSKDYGKEVIEVLIKEMSDGPGDIAIMVAGYPEEMEKFLESNPGLHSRFSYYFHFEDYLPEELLQIADFACKKRNTTLTDDARNYINEMLIEAYRNRDKTFGNARYSYSIIDEAKMNLGLRLMNHPNIKELPNETLSTIEKTDVEKIFLAKQKAKVKLKVNENLLKESLLELNELVGIKNIKEEIYELIKLVLYYHEIGKDVLNKFSLHTVFTGNPGTGKTTMARIIGKIYKALGLLERGHVVECGRDGLVAGYIGQTALKTKAKIDEAKDGVLFIDEAYALSDGSDNDFGKEAIEVILKNMEDLRGQLAIIVAGYPDNMKKFLESNPGLKSRFDRTFQFNDYSPEELLDIFKTLIVKENLKLNTEAEEHLRKYFTILYDSKDKYFGNARTIRNISGEVIKHQNLRMAAMPSEQRTPEMISAIIIDDVKEYEIVAQKQEKTSMGFKIGNS